MVLNSFAGLASITPLNAIWLLSSLAFLQCRALRSLMHRHPSLSNFLVVLTPLASLANPAARRVRTTANSKTKRKSQQSKNIRRSSVWAKYGKSDLFDFIVCIVFIGEARVIRSKPLFAPSLFTPDPLHPPRRWSTTNLSKRQMTLPLPVTHRG